MKQTILVLSLIFSSMAVAAKTTPSPSYQHSFDCPLAKQTNAHQRDPQAVAIAMAADVFEGTGSNAKTGHAIGKK